MGRMKTGTNATGDLVERLADWDHRAWAGWTRYLLDNYTPENVARWERQTVTPYADLSEREKDSDRKEAREILAVIRDEGSSIEEVREADEAVVKFAHLTGLATGHGDTIPDMLAHMAEQYVEARQQMALEAKDMIVEATAPAPRWCWERLAPVAARLAGIAADEQHDSRTEKQDEEHGQLFTTAMHLEGIVAARQQAFKEAQEIVFADSNINYRVAVRIIATLRAQADATPRDESLEDQLEQAALRMTAAKLQRLSRIFNAAVDLRDDGDRDTNEWLKLCIAIRVTEAATPGDEGGESR